MSKNIIILGAGISGIYLLQNMTADDLREQSNLIFLYII